MSATVSQVREVIAGARERLGAHAQRTILFLDEIHRFNKAQQDALLPAVEEGVLTLIGATTENPYFEVNSALLSRSQIYELEPLSDAELALIVRRGADELGTEVSDEMVELIARRAGGDARNALNILELASQTARSEGQALGHGHVDDAARKRPLVYDKGGDAHYDFVSGVHQVDARLRPGRVRLLPGRDARGRRGRALHRAAHDRARLRGHRARRPAGAPRRRGRGAGSRARRPARGAAQPGRGRASTWRARRSRTRSSRRSGRRRRTSASTATCVRRTSCATRTTTVRRSSAAGRATSIRTRIRAASRSTISRSPLKGRKYYRPSGSGEEKGDDHGD